MTCINEAVQSEIAGKGRGKGMVGKNSSMQSDKKQIMATTVASDTKLPLPRQMPVTGDKLPGDISVPFGN